MALDGCGLVCKYILFVFNVILTVVGLAFLGLGLWLRFGEGTRPIFEKDSLSSSAFVNGVTAMIVLGTVMLVVVLLGECGACSGNGGALQVFSALLAILAVAEVTVGVFAWSSREETEDPALGLTLTFFHNVFQCCGMTGIPVIEMVQKTCVAVRPFRIRNQACPDAIMDMFGRNMPVVTGCFVGTGALLVTPLVCSCILLKALKKSN